ncbi:Uncharacterized protein TCM_011867 [Theobroma cacao]|uniref:Uncharacterized protein n=1 Tax=Theobroma cacao TaxID=3641 RepID=A0A061EBZ6_THECC|nr:Uncharacterized protein TCM_011867 [Theobroma cacao]
MAKLKNESIQNRYRALLISMVDQLGRLWVLRSKLHVVGQLNYWITTHIHVRHVYGKDGPPSPPSSLCIFNTTPFCLFSVSPHFLLFF